MPRRPAAPTTDWRQIVGLYDVLLRAEPSPVFELNRAVAVAMWRGPGRRPRAHRRHPRARRSRHLPLGRIRPAPTCAAAWAAWTTPARRIGARWPWRSRNPNGASSSAGCGSSGLALRGYPRLAGEQVSAMRMTGVERAIQPLAPSLRPDSFGARVTRLRARAEAGSPEAWFELASLLEDGARDRRGRQPRGSRLRRGLSGVSQRGARRVLWRMGKSWGLLRHRTRCSPEYRTCQRVLPP